jgi:hypothetical protein
MLIDPYGSATPCGDFYERFGDGLAPYSLLRGSAGIFSISGDVISVASQTSVSASTIQRALTGVGTIAVLQYGCEFRATAVEADDSGQYFVMNGTSTANVLAFTPIRDAVADPSRRPQVYWSTLGGFQVGSSQVALNVWYRFRAFLIPGTGIGWEIISLADGTTWGSGTIAAPTAAAFTADGVAFNADSPNKTGPAQYRECWISSCAG